MEEQLLCKHSNAWTECGKLICHGSEEGFLHHRLPSSSENCSTERGSKIASSHRYRPPMIFFRSMVKLNALAHNFDYTIIDVKGRCKGRTKLVYCLWYKGDWKLKATRRKIMRATNHRAFQKQCEF